MNGQALLNNLSPVELIELYGLIIKELKDREVIRTNNLVGEIGEYLAIDYYKKTSGLPNLQAAPPSTKNIDAISKEGDRYSIKCVTGKTTGVFYGVSSPSYFDHKEPKQIFEYLIIVILNKDFSLQKIIEMKWSIFLKYRKWHSRMGACNLSITKKLEAECKVVFSNLS